MAGEALTGPAALGSPAGSASTLNGSRPRWSAEITAAIEKNRGLAQALGVNGTPAFVVGTDLVPGAIGLEAFRETVGRARQR
jgi:protein-disulfide isomerase